MEITRFLTSAGGSDLTEVEKAEALLFYFYKKEKLTEFDIPTLSDKFFALGYSRPNHSRLKNKLKKSKRFVQGSSMEYFRLHKKTIDELDLRYPFFSEIFEIIVTSNSIIPEDLYTNTRGFISKLAIQINCSYENKIADGCAVLMRRLMEILLILSYRAKNKEAEIKDPVTDQYKNLTSIINYTITSKSLSLQKDTAEVLHDFRELGNFSAHGIQYNCRIDEINKIKRRYRFAVEDLMYSSGLKK